jgi:histidinol phosphatase-like PHP family hydrolase
VDLHSHTTFSDGKTPLELSVRAAEANGLAALAITDHLWQPGRVSGGTSIDEYVAAIDAAQAATTVQLLRGVETTALDAHGTPGIDEATAARLDLVLCDLGGRTRGLFVDGPAEQAAFYEALRRCLVAVCEHRLIDVLAHPFNVGRLQRNLAPDTLPRSLVGEVCAAAAAHDTAVEVMNDMHYWFPEVPIARLTDGYAGIVATAAAAGCRFTVGGDAHHHQGVGNLLWSSQVLERAAVPDDQMADHRSFRRRRRG